MTLNHPLNRGPVRDGRADPARPQRSDLSTWIHPTRTQRRTTLFSQRRWGGPIIVCASAATRATSKSLGPRGHPPASSIAPHATSLNASRRVRDLGTSRKRVRPVNKYQTPPWTLRPHAELTAASRAFNVFTFFTPRWNRATSSFISASFSSLVTVLDSPGPTPVIIEREIVN